MGKPGPNPTPVPNPKPGSIIPHADKKNKVWIICGVGDCEAFYSPGRDIISCDDIEGNECEAHDGLHTCDCELFRAKRKTKGKWKHIPKAERKVTDPKKYYYWCFCARMIDTPPATLRKPAGRKSVTRKSVTKKTPRKKIVRRKKSFARREAGKEAH